MISFLRKIRQKFLSESRFRKYFIYAFGEIILVVIGILIALQINNWNDGQKNLKKEQQVLQNLKAEFVQNLEELQRDHKINLRCLNACIQFLELEKTEKANPQTLDSLLGMAFDFATFDARLGVINDVSSTGKLELIRDENLRLLLNQWTGELNDYSEDVVIRRDYWINNFNIFNKFIPIRNFDHAQNRPDYQRNYKVKPIKTPQKKYQQLLENIEVDGVVYNHYMNQQFVTINENTLEKFLIRIIDLIDKNLRL